MMPSTHSHSVLSSLSIFRNNRRGSYSSSTTATSPTAGQISSPTILPTSVHNTASTVSSQEYRPTSSANETAFSPSLPDRPDLQNLTDDSQDSHSHMPNKLRRSDHDTHYHHPSPAAIERPDSAASTSSRGAQHYIFSLQVPKKFTPSLTPNESPVQSPVSTTTPTLPERSHLRNVSSSSLSVVEEAGPVKNTSSRPPKGKLHLLNPLSLLARRRESQGQPPKPEEGNVHAKSPSYPNLPDDYDPRIRGKIVHDFSVPRSKRPKAYNHGGASAETSPSVGSRPSSQHAQRGPDSSSPPGTWASRQSQSPAHSPVFKEHFENDRQSLRQNFGHSPPSSRSPPSNAVVEPPRLPEFAKSLPLDIFGDEDEGSRRLSNILTDLITPREPQPKQATEDKPQAEGNKEKQEDVSLQPITEQATAEEPSPVEVSSLAKHPSPEIPGQTSRTPSFIRPGEVLPRHATTKSSRFSFQLSGMGSELQERLLEAKHRKHVASLSQDKAPLEDSGSEPSQYSDMDLAENDGLEEKIPGVNVDLDDEDIEPQIPPASSLHFTPLSVGLSPSEAGPTPRDEAGQVIGRADTKFSPATSLRLQQLEFEPMDFHQLPLFSGLGIGQLGNGASTKLSGIREELPTDSLLEGDEDDMYFDDGDIQGLDYPSEGGSFDEDIFDDETGKIADLPAQNSRKLQFAGEQQKLAEILESDMADSSNDEETVFVDKTLPLRIKTDIDATEPIIGLGDSQGVQKLAETSRGGLTEDNLAYQNALVSAANKAAAQGRFTRPSSFTESEGTNAKSPLAESQAGLISDDSRLSNLFDRTLSLDETDEFLFDDFMEDDTMIAEANAEVLANDDDGFYGQEFGFYARAHHKETPEMVNGGYFGPRGVESIHRRHSAKADFQEPSLTPITERSEWSRRNSLASVQTQGLAPAASILPSPGLAQLIDLEQAGSAGLEDDLSLSALLRLRRGAWGGSQTSLSSASGSQNGSLPLPAAPSHSHLESGLVGSKDFSRRLFDSTSMLPGVQEEVRTPRLEDSPDVRPTPRKKTSDPAETASLESMAPSLARTHVGQGPEKVSKGHSRASSGAESVSYTKDPDGSGRWLLERRRTGDDGELEVVGREYIRGERI